MLWNSELECSLSLSSLGTFVALLLVIEKVTIINGTFKQRWSTIPLISTKQTINSHQNLIEHEYNHEI